MLQPGRRYASGSLYRYGFNGKENDNEVKGEGNQQDYGMRIYDPRIGRFLSVDPLTSGYPMLTPYQFASNRPIDGIDLDGLEYYTIHLYEIGKSQGKTVFLKFTEDHTNMTAAQIEAAHKMSSEDFFLRFSKTFESEGRGIKWVYHNLDGTVTVGWEMRQIGDLVSNLDPTETEMEFHGIYSGGGCITTMGPRVNHQGPNTIGKKLRNAYDFGYSPIDEPDDMSKTHDLMQDGIIDYQGWLEDTRTLTSDEWLKGEAKRYSKRSDYANHPGYKDKITGKRASIEAVNRASGIKILFSAAIVYKKFKEAELRRNGYDPNNAAHQQFVTLDDWKPKWYQFGQRAQKAILKKTGGGKTKEEMAAYWKPN